MTDQRMPDKDKRMPDKDEEVQQGMADDDKPETPRIDPPEDDR